MALPFNTFSNEAVPDGTIKTTYDTFYKENTNTFLNPDQRGVLDGSSCTKLNFPGGFQGFTGHYMRTPTGSWGTLTDNSSCNGGTHYFHKSPQKLTDDIATNCAGGSALGYNQFLRDGNNKSCSFLERITNDNFIRVKSSQSRSKGGVHYPTFCQMGDYVSTVPECVDQCKDISPNPEGVGDNYCNFAKNRLCGKLKGDPIKKNSTGSDTINSDKNWILDDMCIDYCGGPDADDTDPTCLENKNNYCSKPDDWYSNEIINEDIGLTKAQYCKTFWTKNFNIDAANNACRVNLTKSFNIDENLLSNKGCGILCPPDGKNQVNKDFCDEMGVEFCENFDRALSKQNPLIGKNRVKYRDFCNPPIEEEETKFDPENPLNYVIIAVSIFAVVITIVVGRYMFSPKKDDLVAHVPVSDALEKFKRFINSLLHYPPCNLKN